ncbi:MAG: response regulator, partial [Deltaproteobacteria bacterium]
MKNRFDTGKVLVIDDEQILRDGAERILKRMEFQVFKASRGEEGLKILEQEPVAIVLLDMKMPGMDGMEVLKRIIELDRGILVIVITGYATVETAIEAMKRGAYDFIPKPYEPDQLRIVVSRAREKMQLTLETEKLEMERKRTLADLHTSQSRVHTIIESLPNGVLVTDTNGKVVLLNPAFKQHLGLAKELMPGGDIGAYIYDKELCKLIIDISRGKYVDFDDIPTYELNL